MIIPETYHTTVDSARRTLDRERVESKLLLPEFGLPKWHVVFQDERGIPIAFGYERIVYGDHGPYIEFLHSHINWNFGVSTRPRPKDARRYYDEYYNLSGTIMLYFQVKNVQDQPNPPKGARRNRSLGYADYRVNRLYLKPFTENLNIHFPHGRKAMCHMMATIHMNRLQCEVFMRKVTSAKKRLAIKNPAILKENRVIRNQKNTKKKTKPVEQIDRKPEKRFRFSNPPTGEIVFQNSIKPKCVCCLRKCEFFKKWTCEPSRPPTMF